MNFVNRTHWDTDDIRAIVWGALQITRVEHRGLKIEIRWAKPCIVSGVAQIGLRQDYNECTCGHLRVGHAFVIAETGTSGSAGRTGRCGWTTCSCKVFEPKKTGHGRWMILRLPRKPFLQWVPNVARVVEHEAWHLAGLNHRDMAKDIRHCNQPVYWARHLQLRIKKNALQETGKSRYASRAAAGRKKGTS